MILPFFYFNLQPILLSGARTHPIAPVRNGYNTPTFRQGTSVNEDGCTATAFLPSRCHARSWISGSVPFNDWP